MKCFQKSFATQLENLRIFHWGVVTIHKKNWIPRSNQWKCPVHFFVCRFFPLFARYCKRLAAIAIYSRGAGLGCMIYVEINTFWIESNKKITRDYGRVCVHCWWCPGNDRYGVSGWSSWNSVGHGRVSPFCLVTLWHGNMMGRVTNKLEEFWPKSVDLFLFFYTFFNWHKLSYGQRRHFAKFIWP